jgi:hypothetical protein
MLNIVKENGRYRFDFDTNFIIEEAGCPTNQYGDSGSIKTFCDTFDKDRSIAAKARDLAANLK